MRLATGMICAALAVCTAASEVSAQQKIENFLDRQLTIVVPYGPGGLTDARGRAFQAHMEDILGVPVVVHNVAGGGALVGINYTYSRPSDGTHVVLASGSDGPHAHAVLSPSNPGWEWEDWKPLGQFAMSVLGFVVNNESEFGTLEDVIAKVKAEPGSVTLASIGPGRADDLYMLEFMKATDTLGKWNWVFYTSSATIQADLLSGDLDVGYIGVSRTDMIDHPNFNVLAQGIAPDEMPDGWPFSWPTVEDVVGQDLDLIGASYASVLVKADTPPERIAFLEQAFAEVAKDPEFQKMRADAGEPVVWRDSAKAQENLDQVHETLKEYKPLRDEHIKQ